MALEQERKWFEKNRADLLAKHEGKWIVVHGEQLIGVYDNFAAAYEDGIRKTKAEEILVRQVTKDDPTFSAPANCLGILSAPTYQS